MIPLVLYFAWLALFYLTVHFCDAVFEKDAFVTRCVWLGFWLLPISITCREFLALDGLAILAAGLSYFCFIAAIHRARSIKRRT